MSKVLKTVCIVVLLVMSLSVLSSCTTSRSNVADSSLKDLSATLTNADVFDQKLTIETGKMDGKPGWPKYIPANFTIPVNRTVELTIISYDDGTAPLPVSSPWNKVWGGDPTYNLVSGGTETVNGKTITSVNPNDVSHTFTVPGLLINIPIPAVPAGQKYVTVTYKFTVKKSGTYRWLCEAPCGSGSMGMGGAMNTFGWMTGYMEVK